MENEIDDFEAPCETCPLWIHRPLPENMPAVRLYGRMGSKLCGDTMSGLQIVFDTFTAGMGRRKRQDVLARVLFIHELLAEDRPPPETPKSKPPTFGPECRIKHRG